MAVEPPWRPPEQNGHDLCSPWEAPWCPRGQNLLSGCESRMKFHVQGAGCAAGPAGLSRGGGRCRVTSERANELEPSGKQHWQNGVKSRKKCASPPTREFQLG